MPAPNIQTVEDTLAERGARYGKFSDHARLAQELQTALHGYIVTKTHLGQDRIIYPWQRLPEVHAQALTVICDKIARILSGDCNYLDNWHDIQGYAKLVEDFIKEEKAKQEAERDKIYDELVRMKQTAAQVLQEATPAQSNSGFKFGDDVLVADSGLQDALWYSAKYVSHVEPEHSDTTQHIVLGNGHTYPRVVYFCKHVNG